MIIDHLGVVVKSIEAGIEQWERLFDYKQMTEIVINTRQRVKVVFLSKQGSLTVKLVQPLDETSPVYKFAAKGGGVHHICFKCNDLNEELLRLSEKGLQITTKPQPGEAFENEDIAFVYARNGLHIELIATDRKANRIDTAGEDFLEGQQ